MELKLRLHSTTTGKVLRLGNAIPVPTTDYEILSNKPQINGVELRGNKTSKDLNIQETAALTNLEIEQIIQNVFN